jgi:hypothetical protein
MLVALGLALSVRVVEQYQLSPVAYFPARPCQRSRYWLVIVGQLLSPDADLRPGLPRPAPATPGPRESSGLPGTGTPAGRKFQQK